MRVLLAIALLAVAGAGCAGRAGTGGPPEGDPYITGTVTSLQPFEQFPPVTEDCVEPGGPDQPVSDADPPQCGPGGEHPARILVEEQPGTDGGNKASLTITRETSVWREGADGVVAAVAEDLREGQTVAAYVSGPVMESFPVQATADAVVITSP